MSERGDSNADPYVPNVVRYQLRYFPISAAKISIYFESNQAKKDFF